MDDVDVFYQREDVWQFATERYRQNFEVVEPYYVMVQFPDRDETEFVLMLPFTPKNKNVMNAWMAGRSDMPNYGDLAIYTFPKGVEVLGPRQIEARIDQDTEMSRALSLWSQRGSEVVRGNLLAIPLFDEEQLYIMFAEPVFLQAEDAQLPEIKRIVLADQNSVVWDTTFEGALTKLLGREAAAAVTEQPTAAAAVGRAPQAVRRAADDAVETFQRFQDSLTDGSYADAGEALEELRAALNRLEDNIGSEEGEEE
jgi:hypothetical protein